MPVEHAIWTMDDEPRLLEPASLVNEEELEDLICKAPAILNDRWLLIGRQVPTRYGKYVDLLALDADGTLIVVELKKNRTPRDVVAQALDYGSWVRGVEPAEIAEIFERFTKGKTSLDAAFQLKFGVALDEETLNQAHQLVVVASSLDASTERIVGYLSDSDIPINVIFFRVVADNGRRYLSRAWLIDPEETEAKASSPRPNREPWNNEFYVSFGQAPGRRWEDARKYGYIAAGGGTWYSKGLFQLKAGDRIWVNLVPRYGYAGVGVVASPAVPIQDFVVKDGSGKQKRLVDCELLTDKSKFHPDDDEKNEYVVGVKWIKAVNPEEAVSEIGFFGNQNTVAKPTVAKWVHTVERLKTIWGVR